MKAVLAALAVVEAASGQSASPRMHHLHHVARNHTHHPNRTAYGLNHSRFSWREAQESMRECLGGDAPAPAEDRFVYFTSTSALGNSLNIWMHVFLYALYSGRQLVVGNGLVPELLCGPAGAFLCGVPHRGRTWVESLVRRNIDADWTRDEKPVHVGPPTWYSYKHMDAATMRGSAKPETKERRAAAVRCYAVALRCGTGGNPRNGVDPESCAMVRAMQLLLPGTRLRREFAVAALATAERQWLGSVDEFRTVVGLGGGGGGGEAEEDRRPAGVDRDAPVFFDPPPPPDDAASRWEGALHLRAMPPALEKEKDPAARDAYAEFVRRMSPGGEYGGVWACASDHARHADKVLAEGNTTDARPRSFFLATDSEGICRVAHAAVEAAHAGVERPPTLSCMDAAPVHLVKPKDVGNRDPLPLDATADDGIDGHQMVVLDWFLLQRSRWLAAASRTVARCVKGARRDLTHDAGSPGKSYFGWALAASGLAVPPARLFPDQKREARPPGTRAWQCDCGIDKSTISVWFPPHDHRHHLEGG